MNSNTKCVNCQEKTTNPKFCSKKCSVTWNNINKKQYKLKPKYCKHCNIPLQRKSWKDRKSCCDDCNKNNINWSSITYKTITNSHNYQKHSRIRSLARSIYKKSNKPKKCIKCGYNLHYDVCHYSPISSFPPNTPISEINHINNLIALCKNHHWELDNGYLDL